MLVPWLAYFYLKDRRRLFLLFFMLILIAKENMALWLIFILLGLMIQGGLGAWRKYLKFEVPLILASAVYFFLVISVIMPSLGAGRNVQLHRYNEMGDSTSSIIGNMVFHPATVAALMFTSPAADTAHASSKVLLHFMVFASGGVALLAAPSYIVMLIPIYLQKMLSTYYMLWGPAAQYSIEFAPIISLALITMLVKLKRSRLQYACVIVIILMTYTSLYSATVSGKMSWNQNLNILSRDHYASTFNISKANKLLAAIPGNAAISVSSSLAPHLSFRDRIYLYPNIEDAQYVVLLAQDSPQDLGSLPQARDFQLLSTSRGLSIYKRKT